jgi:hypothetical protein
VIWKPVRLDSGVADSSSARRKAGDDAILAWSIAAAMLLLVPVAVFVPQNVIAQSRVLQDYIGMSRTLIPGIESLAAVSSFPEVTRLVVSGMWTLVPVFLAVYLFRMRTPESFLEEFRQRRFFLTFACIVVAIVVVSLAVLFDAEPADLERNSRSGFVLQLVSTSRIGLGLVAGFLSATIAAMLRMLLMWLVNVRAIYFSK